MSQDNRIKNAGTKCLWWGSSILVLGVLVSLFGSNLLNVIAGDNLNSGVVGGVTTLFMYILAIIQGVGVQVGAAIFAAGIVLRVLAPRETHPKLDEHKYDEFDTDTLESAESVAE